MLNIILSLILISLAGDTAQPVLTWEPETPAWGEEVTITYHHNAPKAAIKGQVPLYANVQGGEVFKFDREGDVSRVQIPAPDSVSYFIVYFFSLDEWDSHASTQILLETPEGWSML